MTTVSELVPGDEVSHADRWAIFVAATPHPYYHGMQLVIWRDQDGDWYHDALSLMQDIGQVSPGDARDRRESLRQVFPAGQKVPMVKRGGSPSEEINRDGDAPFGS